jgi:hypothetical protein
LSFALLVILKMDEHRHKVLVALVFFMAIRHVMAVVVILQQLALHQHYGAMTMMVAVMVEGSGARRGARSVWMVDRRTNFMERQLLGSYSTYAFKQHTRLLPETFEYLCGVLAPSLIRSDSHMRLAIPVRTRVALSLNRLCSGNSLRGCAETYGIHESTASIIVREFCIAIDKHLKPLVIEKQSAATLRRMAAEFEALKGIPYVIGAVDGSHIPIIAPPIDPTSYYCRKGYYSVLLQGIVDSKCRFWDYDFGWVGRCHDWTLFQNSDIGKRIMRGELLPYKLIGDAAYPMRPWFYSPFKGEKEGLPRAKCHWNFIQSSTRMAVERAFGILKGRWRIILKRVDMPLRHVPNLVTACICLHNLCIIHKDKFDLDWAKEGERLMQRESLERSGQLEKPDIFMAAAEAAKEMRHLLGLEEGIIPIETLDEPDDMNDEDTQEIVETKKEREARVKNMLVQATKAHELMANTLWEAHLRAEGKILFSEPSSDSEEY